MLAAALSASLFFLSFSSLAFACLRRASASSFVLRFSSLAISKIDLSWLSLPAAFSLSAFLATDDVTMIVFVTFHLTGTRTIFSLLLASTRTTFAVCASFAFNPSSVKSIALPEYIMISDSVAKRIFLIVHVISFVAAFDADAVSASSLTSDALATLSSTSVSSILDAVAITSSSTTSVASDVVATSTSTSFVSSVTSSASESVATSTTGAAVVSSIGAIVVSASVVVSSIVVSSIVVSASVVSSSFVSSILVSSLTLVSSSLVSSCLVSSSLSSLILVSSAAPCATSDSSTSSLVSSCLVSSSLEVSSAWSEFSSSI